MTLGWTNPTDSDFAGVMIRYRTDGTYPQSATDGSPVPNGNNGRITGAPGATMSYTHPNLDPDTHYYYSIFTYDTSGNYSHTVFLDGQPLPPESSNQPPTATISASPTSGESPLEVSFFGSGSDATGARRDTRALALSEKSSYRGGDVLSIFNQETSLRKCENTVNTDLFCPLITD